MNTTKRTDALRDAKGLLGTSLGFDRDNRAFLNRMDRQSVCDIGRLFGKALTAEMREDYYMTLAISAEMLPEVDRLIKYRAEQLERAKGVRKHLVAFRKAVSDKYHDEDHLRRSR